MRLWIGERFGATSVQRLALLVELVRQEAEQQSLVAASTLHDIWARHILDSAQLVPLSGAEGIWLDIGTGAGFPGLVVAIIRPQYTLLVEPRRLRSAFLECVAGTLGLDNVEVLTTKVEAVTTQAATISARAVAPAEKLLRAAEHCATTNTRWLLPRGRSGAAELAALSAKWGGQFHVEQSLTDEQSTILVLDGVVRRKGRQ